jgi:hypothetical protein
MPKTGHTPGPWTAAAPALLEILQRLSVVCGEANALQHAGLTVPAKVWAEMYAADNQARAALALASGQEETD